VTRLDLQRIRAARAAIDPVFLDTPQFECAPLGAELGCAVTLKVETLNPVRSFKGRGTETVLARLPAATTAVVCASAGNLGQALAWSGTRRGIAVIVVAGRTANPFKLERLRALGAELRVAGTDIEDARVEARAIAADGRAHLVEDSLDVGTCEGAGTIGLELLDVTEAPDVVLLALGGGALAGGVGEVARALAPGVEVIGIQPVGAPAMALSWRAGSVIETPTMDTIADGVAGRFPIPEVLDDLRTVLDDVLLVEEDSIRAGMGLLFRHAGLVVEPSAALGVAALLENRARFAGRRVATVVCGSNVLPADWAHWIS
jgi:threonine dehydratase